ncbi:uncharacterized protein LOC122554267 [Chiloscyllium plagiosum]|uniref:uncharacterized protein LOC122554267 n=1 Tax=Chiloscyllium plagiosum TaxID=36176 RepID=UPI001CB88126|nr:uncharacterized protein LOC122554267 [Chiloscyllium plagiosum]
MILPNNWVCPFFITFGACMILSTVACCLFHVRKTRNRKREITEWVNAMKYGGKVYHPLLHWIKNNSKLSIKTRMYSTGNEKCKKRKVWETHAILPVRYAKRMEEPGVLNCEAGDSNSMQVGNKPFPKSPVYVASGEASSLHFHTNNKQTNHRSPLHREKSQQQVFPTPVFMSETFANFHKYVMETDGRQSTMACPDVSDSLSSSDNQVYSDSISTRLSDLKPTKQEASTITKELCKTPTLSESNSDTQKSNVYSVPL